MDLRRVIPFSSLHPLVSREKLQSKTKTTNSNNFVFFPIDGPRARSSTTNRRTWIPPSTPNRGTWVPSSSTTNKTNSPGPTHQGSWRDEEGNRNCCREER
jgi:hypothetical protein